MELLLDNLGMQRSKPKPKSKNALLPYLGQWLKFRDMSQEELAAEVGVTQGQISFWKTGKNDVPLSAVHQMAAALRCTPQQLQFTDPFENRAGEVLDVWSQIPEDRIDLALGALGVFARK